MIPLHVKKGDTVTILSGDDKGKSGKVIKAMPKLGKIVVEGLNTVKRHERPKAQGQKGQIVERPMPMSVSKVKKA
jgi:large subunit ribosomal protein L24